MRLMIPALAGIALALLASGLPPLRGDSLTRRVEPYLSGIGGAHSGSSERGAPGLRPWETVVLRVVRLCPTADPSVGERLVAAGRDQTVQAFRVDQILWSSGCGAVAVGAVVLSQLAGGRFSLVTTPVLVVIALAAGWVLADLRLTRAVGRRREIVRSEMPLALDLLTLSVMAGESVPQAFSRVGKMLAGDVGGEFGHVFGSIRSGTSVTEALEELPRRLPEPSAARLVDALCNAMERGAPLADTLRAQAEDLREARRRHLLELGGKREILMLVPVVFLILPTVVAFTLLPGLVSLDLLVP